MPLSNTTLPVEQAIHLAETHYGLGGAFKKLPGEVDYNFYLKGENGQEYTLKISRAGTPKQEIEFQAAIMNHLAEQQIPLHFPEVVHSLKGQDYVELEDQRFLRLQQWVPGRMLAEVNPRSTPILESWGKTCGLLSLHLANFDHPAAHRFYKWNPSEVLAAKAFRSYMQKGEEQELADYYWNLFEQKALPLLPQLRKSVNYSDAHEHNLLCNNNWIHPQVTGVIDFGDALYTETINELAIAAAYAAMYLPDPLMAICDVLKGYQAVFPLEEKELAVLFPLINARLLLTVSNAAWNKHQEPDNEYLLVSEKPAWDLLKKLRLIAPELAHYSFRKTCGLEPCPKKTVYDQWMNQPHNSLSPILNFDHKTHCALDLSVGSLQLGNNSQFDTLAAFEKNIQRLLDDQKSDIGLGGYLEARPFYTTDNYQVEGNSGAQWRTVHLGLDAWTEAGTAVFAPLDGSVHSFQDNEGECNYGPTLILEHRISEEFTFYTLYGHLDRASLIPLKKGMSIRRGQQIANIGSAAINGQWPPHLHFQVILDMLGQEGDFPGVAYPHEKACYASICPNPAPFFPAVAMPNSTSSATDILQRRKAKLGKSLSISYQEPLYMVRAYGAYLYDANGRRYLDTVNNVPHVGHQHPRIVRAAQNQIGVLNTNTRYLHENIVDFAEALAATFPEELSVVHFVNSGSEANELAMRMAAAYTGQKDMVAIEVGYHGNTAACIDVSSYKFDGKGGQGAPPHTHIVPMPDTYRGWYKDPETAGPLFASHVGKAIKKIQAAGRNISAFIGESIISCGGQIVLPKNYLKEVYAQVRVAGGLCIADEVQVGFGRVGEKYWGFELQGVVPDIVTMGKPIGNGHPLAAVITTEKVAQAFANGMEFFNTFGGNPVSCAIGREVIKIVAEENLQAHALDIGNYLKEGLIRLQRNFPIIGEVRGHGFFLGIELVKDPKTLEAAAEAASYLANRMRERGILMSTDGPLHNVLKIKPPMCFDRSNADFLLSNLELVLREDFISSQGVS